MKFWDSSAVVPLLVAEPCQTRLLGLLDQDPIMLVWWGTPVECTSAVARREREGDLGVNDATLALQRLQALAESWQEIVPSVSVRNVAQRLLRVHALPEANALQLASAIVASDGEPGSLDMVSLDDRLNVAAQREGFPVISPN